MVKWQFRTFLNAFNSWTIFTSETLTLVPTLCPQSGPSTPLILMSTCCLGTTRSPPRRTRGCRTDSTGGTTSTLRSHKYLNISLAQSVSIITCNDRSFNCPFMYTDKNSLWHFIHRHLNNAWHKKDHSLIRTKYMEIIASNAQPNVRVKDLQVQNRRDTRPHSCKEADTLKWYFGPLPDALNEF